VKGTNRVKELEGPLAILRTIAEITATEEGRKDLERTIDLLRETLEARRGYAYPRAVTKR